MYSEMTWGVTLNKINGEQGKHVHVAKCSIGGLYQAGELEKGGSYSTSVAQTVVQ